MGLMNFYARHLINIIKGYDVNEHINEHSFTDMSGHTTSKI